MQIFVSAFFMKYQIHSLWKSRSCLKNLCQTYVFSETESFDEVDILNIENLILCVDEMKWNPWKMEERGPETVFFSKKSSRVL